MNETACNLCLLQQVFTAQFVSKAMPILFINGNNNYNYIGLICNSMVCRSIWINSAHNAGMKSVSAVPHTITIFIPALLALLIPNTTANHTITYLIGRPFLANPVTYWLLLLGKFH